MCELIASELQETDKIIINPQLHLCLAASIKNFLCFDIVVKILKFPGNLFAMLFSHRIVILFRRAILNSYFTAKYEFLRNNNN